jgi:pimeloyl-ACP methyl ester carboxylesterase
VAVILSTLDGLGSKSDAILMGKSWGGGLAIEIALGYPERVRALILTAPAYTDFNRLAALQAPVLLAWAEDDPVIPIRYAANYRTIPTFQLITFTGGGHSAASKNAGAFAPVAIKFLQENCSLPAERGFMESLS